MPEEIKTMFESLRVFWNQIVEFLPRFLIGIILFLIGWIVARLLRKGMIKFFRFIRLDSVAEKAGIENFLIKGGALYTSIDLVANVIYWFFLFVLTMAILHLFGLDAAIHLLNNLFSYIPNIIVSILILTFGSLMAKLVRGVLSSYLSTMRIAGAVFIGNIVYWAIILLLISAALQQLSIGGQVIILAFEIAFGGLCLALAVAFGLAGKEWAAQILEKLWRNNR